MDRRSRALSHRLGRQTTPVPTSPPSLDEEDLFLEVFDWNRYCEATQPYDFNPSTYSPSSTSSPSHYYRRSSPDDLSKLIRDIPSVLDNLAIDQLGDDLFRMKTPFHSDDDGHVGTSDYSGQTPPELVAGGSSSSSDHPGSPQTDRADDYRHGSDVALRDFQAHDDEWTYPQSRSPKAVSRGYPAHLQVSEDRRSKTKSSEHGSGLKRRRSAGHDSGRRHRHLADPSQTADVRKSGACLACRVSKVKCDNSETCPTCRKACPELAQMACIRATPAMAVPYLRDLPDVWSRRASEEEELYSGPQFYAGVARDISIFFSHDSNTPCLRATVQGYRSHHGPEEIASLSKADFPRDRVPSHDQLQGWVEATIRLDNGPEFQYALPSFLYAYAEHGRGLPKHSLVKKVHKMYCFFQIIKTSKFWCRDPSNKIVSLPLSVQAQLRHIARKAFRSVEHDVFKELDDSVAQQATPKAEECMATWASMWQLMFMYRELLGAFQMHLSYSRSIGVDEHKVSHQCQQYAWVRDWLFPLIAVLYRFQFRTKKTLEISVDWLKTGKYSKIVRDYKTIDYYARQLLNARRDMYHFIQSSQADIDHILCRIVVDHEVKKLNARKRASKSSSKAHHYDEDDYDDMD